MRIRTTAILATAAAASMVLLAGCGGDGPEGAPAAPATTKAAPARNAAADTPRLYVVDANGNDARQAFVRQVNRCTMDVYSPAPTFIIFARDCILNSVEANQHIGGPYPSFKVETTNPG